MALFSKKKLDALTSKMEAEQAKEKKYRILLVDDEKNNLESLENLLSEEYHVETAEDGQDALQKLEEGEDLFHLIISDQRMPRLTGVKFLERSLDITPKTKRIILSGFTDVNAIIASINKAKIHEFLLKPIDNHKFMLTVQRALESYELEEKNHHLLQDLMEANATLEAKVDERTAELNLRNRELETLDSIVQVINQEVVMDNVLRTMLDQVLVLFPQVERGLFITLDPQDKVFKMTAMVGHEWCGGEDETSFSIESLHQWFVTPGRMLEDGIYFQADFAAADLQLDWFPRPVPDSVLVMEIRLQDHVEGFLVLENFAESEAAQPAVWQKLKRYRDHAVSAMNKAKILHELQQKTRFIRKTFGRYLSESVVENLLEDPEGLRLGGEKRHVTLMLSDIRGFSTIAENRTPEEVVSMLNRYLGAMVDIIMKYRGTIDEIIGDAILVIFGAPLSEADDAERALACAMEMQQAMAAVNRDNRQAQLPEIHMGIGINSGEVVVGNIGSTKRMKYGVVGNQINLTARIESYTVGGQILISQNTHDEVSAPLSIRDRIVVEPKGVKEPIPIYEVEGLGEPYNLYLDQNRDPLIRLSEPLPLHFRVLEEKDVNLQEFEGVFTELSSAGAVLESNYLPDILSNLKVLINSDLAEGDLYAKVTTRGEGFVKVHFTSMTSSVRNCLTEFTSSRKGS